MTPTHEHSVDLIQRLSAVPTILEMVARTTGLRFTAVARVSETRWTACAVNDQLGFGLRPGDDLVLESTICDEIREHRQPVVIGHASLDPKFKDHPTPKQYGFESYISIPIVSRSGRFFGTLCALDPKPAKLDTPEIVKSMQLFAQLLAAQIDIEDQLAQSEARLSSAAQTAVQREQFVAMLGHDLRNPLHMIGLGIESAQSVSVDPKVLGSLALVKRSLARMNELVSNLLDFASGELGGGIPVSLVRDPEVVDALQHVVAELRSAHPHRDLRVAWRIERAVVCDRHRLAQVLSNLLSNALAHGAPGSPIDVDSHTEDDRFRMVVSNIGPPIPEEAIPRLFHPFTRVSGSPRKPGLGLGLFIASEIARAHRGQLTVVSNESKTAFTFEMQTAA